MMNNPPPNKHIHQPHVLIFGLNDSKFLFITVCEVITFKLLCWGYSFLVNQLNKHNIESIAKGSDYIQMEGCRGVMCTEHFLFP